MEGVNWLRIYKNCLAYLLTFLSSCQILSRPVAYNSTLNSSKTEYLLIGVQKQLAKIHNSLDHPAPADL